MLDAMGYAALWRATTADNGAAPVTLILTDDASTDLDRFDLGEMALRWGVNGRQLTVLEIGYPITPDRRATIMRAAPCPGTVRLGSDLADRYGIGHTDLNDIAAAVVEARRLLADWKGDAKTTPSEGKRGATLPRAARYALGQLLCQPLTGQPQTY